MEDIIKKYIFDNKNKKVAVQIDIGIFEKIENILEDYGLYKLMEETNKDDNVNLEEAKKIYEGLDKTN